MSLPDESYLRIAHAIAEDARCTRRKVGAIIVAQDTGHIVATGRNGAPPGDPECTDGACPRGRHYETRKPVYWKIDSELLRSSGDLYEHACACTGPWPCPYAVAPGSSYDTGPGTCIAIHAEANALLNRTVPSVAGAVMYVTEEPCDGCRKLIKGARLLKVKWPGGAFKAVK